MAFRPRTRMVPAIPARALATVLQVAARRIWKRYALDDPEWALATAVASGVVTRESLPPAVLGLIDPLLESLGRNRDGDGDGDGEE